MLNKGWVRVWHGRGRTLLSAAKESISVRRAGRIALVRDTWPWPDPDRRRFDEEWGSFRPPFIGLHRPLSVYFSAIGAAGLTVRALQEPAAEAPAGLTAEQVERIRMTPLSVVLKITH